MKGKDTKIQKRFQTDTQAITKGGLRDTAISSSFYKQCWISLDRVIPEGTLPVKEVSATAQLGLISVETLSVSATRRDAPVKISEFTHTGLNTIKWNGDVHL